VPLFNRSSHCIEQYLALSRRRVGANDPDPRSDLDLVRDISAGDSSAFDTLYFRYRDWVVGLAVRFTGDRDDALDVLQETFAYLVRRLGPNFELTASMKTFLYPAVRNLALEIRRKRRRGGACAGELNLDAIPAPPVHPSDDRAELANVMCGLPEGQREVLLMRFVDGFSLEEIAQALAIPPGTVKSRLHNAIQTLRADPRVRRYFEN
jgi:RNA polymerase sigma-70 factor (ECF subfamily)